MGAGASRGQARALHDDLASLKQELAQSIQRTRQLEARVHELESLTPNPGSLPILDGGHSGAGTGSSSGNQVLDTAGRPALGDERLHEADSPAQTTHGVQETKATWVTRKCAASAFFRDVWSSVDQVAAPMLVVSLDLLERHGRLPRSDDGLATPFLALPVSARVVFVSHRWLRPHHDPSCAHPDDANRSKHALLCAGLRQLAARKGWHLACVHVWLDFACIEQDDVLRKVAGIESLRGYAAACDELLVPCASAPSAGVPRLVDRLPGEYGERAWTRLEALTYFSLSALGEPGSHEIHAVAAAPVPTTTSHGGKSGITKGSHEDTALSSIGAPEPKGSALYFERFFYSFASGLLPSAGVLFNEADRAGIARHEEAILGFLAQGLGSPPVMREFISRGMLAGRPIGDAGASSVAVLLEMEQLEGSGAWVVGRDALPASRVSLAGQHIGDTGAQALAVPLEPRQKSDGHWVYNGAMEDLDLSGNSIGDEGAVALAGAIAPRPNADGSWGTGGLWAGGIGRGALASLNLQRNCVRDKGATALADALAPRQNPGDGCWVHHGAWQRLCLSENPLGPEGIHALASALSPRLNPDGRHAWNTSLTYLDVRPREGEASSMDDAAWTAMAEALRPRLDPDGSWSASGLTPLEVLAPWQGDGKAKAVARCLLAPAASATGEWVFNPAIKSLSLAGEGFSDEGWAAVAEALAPRLNPDGCLASHPSIDVLKILTPWEGDTKARAVARRLLAPKLTPAGEPVFNPAISTLYLKEALRPVEAPDGSWASNPYLTSLNVSGDKVDDAGVRALAEVLRPVQSGPASAWAFPCPALRYLNVANRQGREGLAALAEALQWRLNPDNSVAHHPALNAESALSNWRGDGKLSALASYQLAPKSAAGETGWVFNDKLTALRHTQMGITSAGAQAVASALVPRQAADGAWRFNDVLQCVDLSYNDLLDEGVAALSAALRPRAAPGDGSWCFNATLTALHLHGVGMGVAGAAALAEALAPQQQPSGAWEYGGSLKELLLSENCIGDVGAAAIASVIAPRQSAEGSWTFNTKLQRLLLAGNQIGSEGATAVAEAIQPRQSQPAGCWSLASSLVYLSLADNTIGAEAGAAMCRALLPRKNPDGGWVLHLRLQDFLLHGKDSEEAENAVRPALQACAVVRRHLAAPAGQSQRSSGSTDSPASVDDVELLLGKMLPQVA
eukprot:jgi/Tetstr1/463079/TSEL_008014.t1